MAPVKNARRHPRLMNMPKRPAYLPSSFAKRNHQPDKKIGVTREAAVKEKRIGMVFVV